MGKRIFDESLIRTTFNEAVLAGAFVLTDAASFQEAKPIPIAKLGNAYVQSSADGITFRNTILPGDTHLRISIDGGTTWKLLTSNSSSSGDSHLALTLVGGNGLELDEANQVISLNLASTQSAGAMSIDDKNKVDLIKNNGEANKFLNEQGDYVPITGSETKESILQKLEVEVLSGNNTGDQDLSNLVEKVAGSSLIEDVEKERLSKIHQTVYTIDMQASKYVSGRIPGAIVTVGGDIIEGWEFTSGSNDADLIVDHNLGRRLADVKIFYIYNGMENLLVGNLAYSSFSSDGNRVVIKSLATIDQAIVIYLIFA